MLGCSNLPSTAASCTKRRACSPLAWGSSMTFTAMVRPSLQSSPSRIAPMPPLAICLPKTKGTEESGFAPITATSGSGATTDFVTAMVGMSSNTAAGVGGATRTVATSSGMSAAESSEADVIASQNVDCRTALAMRLTKPQATRSVSHTCASASQERRDSSEGI